MTDPHDDKTLPLPLDTPEQPQDDRIQIGPLDV